MATDVPVFFIPTHEDFLPAVSGCRIVCSNRKNDACAYHCGNHVYALTAKGGPLDTILHSMVNGKDEKRNVPHPLFLIRDMKTTEYTGLIAHYHHANGRQEPIFIPLKPATLSPPSDFSALPVFDYQIPHPVWA